MVVVVVLLFGEISAGVGCNIGAGGVVDGNDGVGDSGVSGGAGGAVVDIGCVCNHCVGRRGNIVIGGFDLVFGGGDCALCSGCGCGCGDGGDGSSGFVGGVNGGGGGGVCYIGFGNVGGDGGGICDVSGGGGVDLL